MRAVACALLILALSGCNGAFYRPDDRVYGSPAEHFVAFDDVRFESGDGTRLHGWFLKPKGKPRGTVVHMHGNAANITAHAGQVAWLTGEGFQVFVFDYRGYGRSEGDPTRDGVHRDALAALRYVRARKDVDPARLVVFGQSLGGAVALAAVGEDRTGVCGVAVEGTFADYVSMGNQVLGGSPITHPLAWLLVSREHDPRAAAEGLTGLPSLVIHSRTDEVVPYAEGLEVFEALPAPTALLTLHRGRHLAAMQSPGPRAQLVGFFDRCLASPRR